MEWDADAHLAKNVKGSLRTPEFDVLTATIKGARERAGLSQRETARRMGFTSTVYGKTERGDRDLGVVDFVKLAEVLGTDPLNLLGDYLIALQKERLDRERK